MTTKPSFLPYVFVTGVACGACSSGSTNKSSNDAEVSTDSTQDSAHPTNDLGSGDSATLDTGSTADSDAANDTTSAPSAWQSRGVGGGGAFFVPEIGPRDDQLFMSTDMGTVFHSTNYGASWSSLDFRNLSGGNLAQVGFTSNSQVLYALGGDQNGYVSSDGGNTFTQLTDPNANGLYYIQVDPTSSNRFLVTNYTKLYFSGDGATLKQVYTGADSNAGLILGGAFWDGNNIYVGTNDGLVVSTNGGQSFALQNITGVPSGQAIVSFAGAKQGTTTQLFAVTIDTSGGISAGQEGCDITGSSVYTLTVGQTAWTNASSGLPANHQPVFVGMATGTTNVAYIAGTESNLGVPIVDKTTDGGTTWVSVLQTTGNANVATGWSGSGGDTNWGFGQCAEGFAVSTADANRAVITDMGFVHVTKDGGATWQQAYDDPATQNPAGSPTPKGRAYHGIGAEDTSAWWLTWPAANTVFESVTDITSARSTDDGVHWVRDSQDGLTQNTTYQALVAPSGTLYAPTASVHDMYMSYRLADNPLDSGTGTIMQSIDQGAHWTLLHDFGHNVVFLALDPTNANSMYASVVNSTSGGIYHTTTLNQGATASWSQLPAPARTQGHPYNIAVLKDGTVVATFSGRRTNTFTDSAGVFTLAPGATAWTDVSDATMHWWVKDLVVDSNDSTQNTWYVGVFYAFGANNASNTNGTTNGLYRTTNRGQSWQEILAGHNVESCTVDPLNPDHMLATTESDGLFSTTNLTAATPSFTADTAFPFLHPLRVFFNPFNQSEAWVAAFGGGLWVREF